MDEYKIDYHDRMLKFYPDVFKAIREFQALTETESVQIEEMHDGLTKILEKAYIATADESRIAEWEQLLGITPLPQGSSDMDTWLSDRRDTVLARLYNPEKLNAETISEIVSIFTGGTAISHFKNGTLYIEITPPPENKSYQFANVEQELKHKLPAHLGLEISRNYHEWSGVKDTCATWQDVLDTYGTWENAYIFIPFT